MVSKGSLLDAAKKLTRGNRKSTHCFSLHTRAPQRSCAGGNRIDCRKEDLPILNGMSLSLLTLEPKGVREPHWHPNTNELSYCLEGSALMTIFSPRAGHDTFTLEAGDIAFVPKGYLHHIENTGRSSVRLLLGYDSDVPEDFDLSAGVSAMPDSIMATTFNQSPSFFAGLKKTRQGAFITLRSESAIPSLPQITGRYKMMLENANPQVSTSGGWVKISNQFFLPALEGIAVYSLLLKPRGGREPHWHPNANELNYLIRGNVRITLLSPGGQIDTFDMAAGDLSFLPRGYLHSIENTGHHDAHFAIFFDHHAPNDMGMSGCLGAYSNEVLASLFGVSAAYVDRLPKYQEDLLVVGGG